MWCTRHYAVGGYQNSRRRDGRTTQLALADFSQRWRTTLVRRLPDQQQMDRVGCSLWALVSNFFATFSRSRTIFVSFCKNISRIWGVWQTTNSVPHYSRWISFSQPFVLRNFLWTFHNYHIYLWICSENYHMWIDL